jgi:hypothetical protein
VALAAGLTAFAQTDPLEQSPWNSLPSAAALAGALSVLAAFFALGPWQRLGPLQLRAVGAGLSLVTAGLALSVTHTRLWQGDAFKPPRGLHWLDAKIELSAPLRPLYQALREQTPNDARFLIPPGMSAFRLAARRSVFVDWKCAPMRGDEALEWQRRMLLALGMSSFPAQGYQLPRAADAAYFARPVSELIALARQQQLTHVLTARTNIPTPPGTQRVLQSGRYSVYQLFPTGP